MSTTLQSQSLSRSGAVRADAASLLQPMLPALRRRLLARWDAACRRAEDPRRRVPRY